jgi:xylulokinase
MAARLGPDAAMDLCGNRVHPYFLGPKLAWLASHEPRKLERTAWVLQSHSFIVFKLTNEATCDESTAMLCSPLFNARARSWSSEAARVVGIAPRLLPRIVRSHDVVGAVTGQAARATGLREGTPVVAGGGDFASASLGAGVVEEGQACLMLGTAGNLLMPMGEPRFDSRLINTRHVGCDMWLALGGTICGAALEWFRRTCAPDATWDDLEAEAARVPPGAEGVLVLPYLQGERTPLWNARARAVFFGAGLAHGRGHLFRALVEGIALGFRHCLAVAQENGIELHEVVAANGAGRSGLLRQTLCDALGVPLSWDGGAGATVAGAAVLAGLGIGCLKDARAPRTWAKESDRVHHTPDARVHGVLEKGFARRLALYGAVQELFV